MREAIRSLGPAEGERRAPCGEGGGGARRTGGSHLPGWQRRAPAGARGRCGAGCGAPLPATRIGSARLGAAQLCPLWQRSAQEERSGLPARRRRVLPARRRRVAMTTGSGAGACAARSGCEALGRGSPGAQTCGRVQLYPLNSRQGLTKNGSNDQPECAGMLCTELLWKRVTSGPCGQGAAEGSQWAPDSAHGLNLSSVIRSGCEKPPGSPCPDNGGGASINPALPSASSLVSSLYSTGKITEQTKGVKKPAVILKIKTKLVVMRWAPTAAAWLYHLQAAAAAPQAAALTE